MVTKKYLEEFYRRTGEKELLNEISSRVLDAAAEKARDKGKDNLASRFEEHKTNIFKRALESTKGELDKVCEKFDLIVDVGTRDKDYKYPLSIILRKPDDTPIRTQLRLFDILPRDFIFLVNRDVISSDGSIHRNVFKGYEESKYQDDRMKVVRLYIDKYANKSNIINRALSNWYEKVFIAKCRELYKSVHYQANSQDDDLEFESLLEDMIKETNKNLGQ